MKAYWYYRCDFGHSWVVFRDENAEENENDTWCSYGHEAVTLQKCPIINQTEICLRPAEQIADRVKHQVILKDQYYIVVRDLNSEAEKISRYSYLWNSAVGVLHRLKNMSFDDTVRMLDTIDRETNK